MKIAFHGAARTVTGSKHLVELNSGKKILLDCGMFQGLGKETLQLNSNWGFNPSEVTYVVISHAHIDHVGLLPKLVKDGFNGKIFCTTQTVDVAKLLLLDSAHIQEGDAEHENRYREKHGEEIMAPLYTQEDAEKVFPLFNGIPYNTAYAIDNDVELYYTDCGHILGSAAVNLKIKEDGKITRLTFSGDIGRYNDMILRAPDTFPQADYIIMESTYGNKLHDLFTPSADKLLDLITHTCLQKKGKLIIPAFSVGRTQEILYLLNRLENERRLPALNYYVDSPLSAAITNLIKQHPECFNKDVQELLKKDHDVFGFNGLIYTHSAEESIEIGDSKEPCVIIAASGMAEAGRVKHHIQRNIENPANSILIVGYCEPHSLGGHLRNGDKEVNIYGKMYEVRAEVGVIESMSAHGDYNDLLHWTSCQDVKQVRKLFLVHGEYEVQVAFRERLMHKGFEDVEIPMLHQEITL